MSSVDEKFAPPVQAALTPANADHPLRGASDGAFRDDLERIRFSPYFSRLAAVTQVISQGAAGQVVHNRLTHTIKVTAVARAIAIGVNIGPGIELINALGGCDPVVVQAAASAHDLGHPPFGHLGERMLDRVARSRFGLVDGFEGNAQTFRILTELGVHGTSGSGLNLTAAVRAAVLKYPWCRVGAPNPHPYDAPIPPRGAGGNAEAPGSVKYSSYLVDAGEMAHVRQAYPEIDPWQQTPECAVMDVADDIAYSLHDLDDFHRTGILQHASVAAEFRTWMQDRAGLTTMDLSTLRAKERRRGHSLELLRRRLRAKDAWIFDDDAFAQAVERVGIDLIDGLLAVPYDGSIDSERAIGVFTNSWIAHFQDSVQVVRRPHVRSAHVALGAQAWHEVGVLKFVHQRFVLDRPDLAMYQRGQGQILTTLVSALDSWLADSDDAHRAPRRLVDLVELATQDYRRLRLEAPELLRGPNGEDFRAEDDILRLGRGRGIIDYVASLTDDRAVATAAFVTGSSSQLWDAGSGL
ncbi:dNTP triphosphohydrolase [Nakamurella antarctica]|uniref:DNTP triphosphohydrolase n=2 Tax=Nakamurella antarctica TaxID=1902245 RepID=A0A3G8ZRN9_9ACTN|nr:dNTP triphosphohydrolase [Nakamurella antarctica]